MENNGEAKWYVVHTYTGHEKMVEDNLKKMIENSNLQDFIQEIAIPVEEDIVEKNGKKKVVKKKKNSHRVRYDTGEMNEALNFLTYHDIMKADFGYLCSSTQNIPLCQRHRDFCALLDDDIIMANIKKLSIETLKRYSIRNRSQLARLFIYKLKFVWILTAKTWIKQKIWKR